MSFLLLLDRTTKKNIIFTTDSYAEQGIEFSAKNHLTEQALQLLDIQPRVLKNAEEQVLRTRKKAEVFTPAWVCCMMNNHADAVWFGRYDMDTGEVIPIKSRIGILDRKLRIVNENASDEVEIREERDKVLISIIGVDDEGAFSAASAFSTDEFMSGEDNWLEQAIGSILFYGKVYED